MTSYNQEIKYNSSVQKSFEHLGQNAESSEDLAPPSFHDASQTIINGEAGQFSYSYSQNQISMPLLLEDEEDDLNMTQMV